MHTEHIQGIERPARPDLNQTRRDQLRGERLTRRERETLLLLVIGWQAKQIGAELGVSTKTVEKHRQGVYSKTGVHGAVQLAHLAIRCGLVENLYDGAPVEEWQDYFNEA